MSHKKTLIQSNIFQLLRAHSNDDLYFIKFLINICVKIWYFILVASTDIDIGWPLSFEH